MFILYNFFIHILRKNCIENTVRMFQIGKIIVLLLYNGQLFLSRNCMMFRNWSADFLDLYGGYTDSWPNDITPNDT